MVEHQPEHSRFVVTRDDQTAQLNYQRDDMSVDFIRTWTPPALRGQGVAADLVAAGIAWARQEELQIRTSCSYVASWLQRESARD